MDATSAATTAAMYSNPYTAVLGAFLQSGIANAPPAAPTAAYGGTQGNGPTFDNSGFNVSMGGNSPISTQRSQETAGPLNDLTKYLPYAVIGAGVLIAWKYLKK